MGDHVSGQTGDVFHQPLAAVDMGVFGSQVLAEAHGEHLAQAALDV